MPSSSLQAINFLETQWSSINDNKVKGILAEIAFKNYLQVDSIHCISGGWLLSPGNKLLCPIPPREKICIIPRRHFFSWQSQTPVVQRVILPAEMSAYNYFRQVGVRALFVSPTTVNEAEFSLPTPSSGTLRAKYSRPYTLVFHEISPAGDLVPQPITSVFHLFPLRNGNIGLRCHKLARLNPNQFPWTDVDAISDLFWFEYARYYIQVEYLVSNNDLDFFLIGTSGSCYPVELKGMTSASDSTLGAWFGIDMGPYAKLSFFTSNSMNTDALYIGRGSRLSDSFINSLSGAG